MKSIIKFVAVVFLANLALLANTAERILTENPFLQPYIHQLNEGASAADLASLTAMAKSELILLHHGYGTGIRNRWIHGDRDPALVRFFRSNGVHHPDEMSMVLLEVFWFDLNSRLTPEERSTVESKRATVARKRATYEKLESEGRKQLADAQSQFESCYAKHGLPSKNPVSRDPFFKLIIEKSDRIREIIFFVGASSEIKPCLAETINGFRFSSFTDDEFVTLYILQFPGCRIQERDTLHR